MAKAKQQVTEVSEGKAPEAVLSFEDFLSTKTIHPGLVASFRYEEGNGGRNLEPRSEGAWIQALEEQSKRTY
jgi:hypothetical protein